MSERQMGQRTAFREQVLADLLILMYILWFTQDKGACEVAAPQATRQPYIGS